MDSLKSILVFLIVVLFVFVLVLFQKHEYAGGGVSNGVKKKVHFNRSRHERWFDSDTGRILLEKKGRT